MANARFRLRVKVNQKVLGTQVANSPIKESQVDSLLEIVGELQANTPVGATGRLKAGWDVEFQDILIGSSIQFIAQIVNRAEYAEYGIIGRGPGLMPPYQPIEDFVIAKGSVNPKRDAWRVRVAIAKRGTIRWRNNDNWVGLNRDGSIKPDSPLRQWKEKFQLRINRI
jgi:hypothetical protein